MKHIALFALLFLAAGLSSARAQSADDQYVALYSLIQQADTLADAGQPRPALTQYTEAQTELQKFKTVFPDWNPQIVTFRLKYLAEKIADLTAELPPPTAAVETNLPPAESAAVKTDAELAALRSQLQALQSDNATLVAKLKEALAARPAMVGVDELAKAQEQIRSLMKENDLLKASRKPGELVTGADTNALAQAQGKIQSLMKENAALKLTAARPQPENVVIVDTNSLFQSQTDLAAANQKLALETGRADKLAAENQALQTRMQSLLASPDAMQALHDENALLKKQLAALRTSATNLSEPDQLEMQLKKARLQIAALQSDTQVKQLEKAALENRLQQLQSATNGGAAALDQSENTEHIKELTQERDDLLGELGEANKQLYGGKKQDLVAQVDQLTDQIRTLRERIAVDEAQVVPYTPAELALFQQAAPEPANPDAQEKSISQLPPGSAALVAEAQSFFAAKQYDRAETNYLKILQQDENNALVLGNLAAIELQEGNLAAAEQHITNALAQNPDDAYNLATLGYLKFRQGKYDDALNALSRAAKLAPRNPEIQNYLGVTLSHKGLRTQAETALRKAIELDPDYAAAHNNLAVIYLSEQPPMVELARWHYQKALADGQPHNPELEKKLAAKGAPVAAQ
jgi:tetratricopeptide (TPR) repeat protein